MMMPGNQTTQGGGVGISQSRGVGGVGGVMGGGGDHRGGGRHHHHHHGDSSGGVMGTTSGGVGYGRPDSLGMGGSGMMYTTSQQQQQQQQQQPQSSSRDPALMGTAGVGSRGGLSGTTGVAAIGRGVPGR